MTQKENQSELIYKLFLLKKLAEVHKELKKIKIMNFIIKI